jgi:hypothetical protein
MAAAADAPLLPETPDRDGAYPRLDAEQIQVLAPHGQRRRTEVGDVLYREGEEPRELVVILRARSRSSTATERRTSAC